MKKALTIIFLLLSVCSFSQITPRDSLTTLGVGGSTTKQIVIHGFCINCAAQTFKAGTLRYDSLSHSLAFDNDNSNVELNIGQEFWVRVYNGTGSTITNGSVVYISGNDGSLGFPSVSLAKADSTVTGNALGIATQDITNNSWGFITTQGIVNGLNTNGLTPGASVYVSASSAGAFTTTQPSAPNYPLKIGIIGKANSTTGTIVTSIGALVTRVQRVQNASNTDNSVTGSTSETILKNLLLPGNSVGANDIFTFNAQLLSVGANGSKTFRAYLSPNNNSLTGAVLIGTCQMSTANLYSGFTRSVANKNSQSTNDVYPASSSSPTDFAIVNTTRTSTNINFANRQYLIITCQLQNGSDQGLVLNIYTVINQTN